MNVSYDPADAFARNARDQAADHEGQEMPGLTSDDGSVITSRDLRGLVRRHLAMLLLAMICGGAAGAFLASRATPFFTTEAVVVIDQKASIEGEQDASAIPPEWLIATERDILGAQATIEAAVATLPLPPPELPASPVRHLLDLAKRAAGGGNATAAQLPSRAEIAKSLQGSLAVWSNRHSMAIHVRFASPSPEFSALFVNALVKAYRDQKSDASARRTMQSLEDIDRRIVENEQKISAALEEIVRLRASPNSQFLLKRRQEDLAALQTIAQSLSTRRLELAIMPPSQPHRVVSPAWIPHRVDKISVLHGAAAGAVAVPAILFLLIVMANGVFKARRHRGKSGAKGPEAW